MTVEKPKHFIVIVPGYMGSLLRDKKKGDIVWLDLPGLLKNPFSIGDAINDMLARMAYPNDDLEPAGVLNEVLVIPPWAKQEHYGRFIEQLKRWGYAIDPQDPGSDVPAAYTFSYDWRQDNRRSAQQLGEAIDRWRKIHPGAEAWLVAHSNGGIVSRWYIQEEGGRDHVGKLMLMGSPWDGAPKAIKVMMDGLDVLGLKRFNLWNLGSRVKELIRTFPSFYQLIPHVNPFLEDQDNNDVDLFADTSWLSSEQEKAYLADALKFNQTMAKDPGVETICFYGMRKPTTTKGILTRGPAGTWENIQWIETGAGDGTVPSRSAQHPWIDEKSRLPFPVTHGDIYVDAAVLEFVHAEIAGKYAGQARPALYLPDISILFEAEHDFYAPGDAIVAWVEVRDSQDGSPRQDMDIFVEMQFREPLPGMEVHQPPSLVRIRLKEKQGTPGRYEAVLTAPTQEGYYTLQAQIRLPDQSRVSLDELIVVEADVD